MMPFIYGSSIDCLGIRQDSTPLLVAFPPAHLFSSVRVQPNTGVENAVFTLSIPKNTIQCSLSRLSTWFYIPNFSFSGCLCQGAD